VRDLLEHVAQQLREPRERQRGFRLDTAARQDGGSATSLSDACLPQDRLADARLAGEEERGRTLLDASEECLDRAELFLAPDDLRRHASGHCEPL